MTDDTTAADRAERIRRLQEQRARAGHRASTATATDTRRAKPRRRHPAMATRILLAGMSVASFFGIAGSVALANGATSTAAATPVAVSPVAVTPAVAQPASPAPAQAAGTATAAKPGVARTAAPHVTTRGS